MSWSQNQNDRKPRNNYFVKIEHPWRAYTAIGLSNHDFKLKSIPLPKRAKNLIQHSTDQ